MIVLETRDLCKYIGEFRAVDGVSLQVQQGEIRSIIGPNGAGKSTLFNLVSGAATPTRGRVFFAGRDITALARFQRARLGLAKADQICSIFPSLTVLENVRLGVQAIGRRNFDMLRPAESSSDELRRAWSILKTVGLSSEAHRNAANLSYGDKKRLEIAMMLAIDPKVLLLDEPTSGVSPEETQVIVDLVKNIGRTLTVVLIEHDMDIVLSISDRVTVLHRGRVLFEGSPDEVERNDQVKEVYLGTASNRLASA